MVTAVQSTYKDTSLCDTKFPCNTVYIKALTMAKISYCDMEVLTVRENRIMVFLCYIPKLGQVERDIRKFLKTDKKPLYIHFFIIVVFISIFIFSMDKSLSELLIS